MKPVAQAARIALAALEGRIQRLEVALEDGRNGDRAEFHAEI